MVYRKVSVDITEPQLRKASQGKQITLSAAQLQGSGATIHVHPANYEKMMKAKRGGRGVRIFIAPGAIKHDLDVMQGGSVWKWLKEKLFPAIKPALSGVLDAAVAPVSAALGPYAPAAILGRQALKGLTGVGVAKGSQAAKDRMAKVRAAKKGGSSGGSFRLS